MWECEGGVGGGRGESGRPLLCTNYGHSVTSLPVWIRLLT